MRYTPRRARTGQASSKSEDDKDGTAAQGTHFWFMSLALITSNGMSYYRRTGHLSLNPGATRFNAFEEILSAMKDQTPELQDAVVLAFDIQPNAL